MRRSSEITAADDDHHGVLVFGDLPDELGRNYVSRTVSTSTRSSRCVRQAQIAEDLVADGESGRRGLSASVDGSEESHSCRVPGPRQLQQPVVFRQHRGRAVRHARAGVTVAPSDIVERGSSLP